MEPNSGPSAPSAVKITLPLKVLWLIGAILALLVGGGLSYAIINHNRHTVPRELAELSADTLIYYPANLPKGYSYDSSLFKRSADITIYGFRRGKSQPLLVSTQPKPKEVKFDDFYNRLLVDKADIASSEGKAVIGTAGGKTIGSLLTDRTWVLVNSPSGLDRKSLGDFLGSLTRIKQ